MAILADGADKGNGPGCNRAVEKSVKSLKRNVLRGDGFQRSYGLIQPVTSPNSVIPELVFTRPRIITVSPSCKNVR